MKSMKNILAIALAVCMALALCACGDTGTVPAGGESAYIVRVVDEEGNPIAGAMVQLCKDACVPGTTDETGAARFSLPADDYKAAFVMLPAGYDYVDETREFYFEDGSQELTITLKAAA